MINEEAYRPYFDLMDENRASNNLPAIKDKVGRPHDTNRQANR